MGHILLLGAGFSRNWGAPLANEITGSLLGELHDDTLLAQRLRSGPFEDAFAGFQRPRGNDENSKRLRRLQDAVASLFSRINNAFPQTHFEFSDGGGPFVKEFLEKFDAIFTLNQDLLLEIHYMSLHTSERWRGVVMPGMQLRQPELSLLKSTWQPQGGLAFDNAFQPYFKLHGSSNWKDESGEPVLIMGSAKSGAIERFPVLKAYHERFQTMVGQPGMKLMVIGYSFQDDHINRVICDASVRSGLGTFLVDPLGRDVLKDPKMTNAMIKPKRDVEDIRIIGELKRSLSTIFNRDVFAHGELMRFFG